MRRVIATTVLLCAAFAAALCAAGCAGFFFRPPSPPPPSPAISILGQNGQLEPGQRVYIARPPVTEENNPGAQPFGRLEDGCREVLERYASSVVVADREETRGPALASAKKVKARYLVMPSLDTATLATFAQAPSADIRFFLSVFDVDTQQHLIMRYVRVSTAGVPLAEAPELLRSALAETVFALFAAGQRQEEGAAPPVANVPAGFQGGRAARGIEQHYASG